MGKYDLTLSEIETGVSRVLAEAYATTKVSTNPKLIFVSAGPGAGKTTVIKHYTQELRKNNEKAYIMGADNIAKYHPKYSEALEELPQECYRITREFVRPAKPLIMEQLIKKGISIIEERTFKTCDNSDIEMIRAAKKRGYTIISNIVATDIFESRLSCFERESYMLQAGLTPRGCSKENQMRMYNPFIESISKLDNLNLLDEINVFIRGENISKPPILKFSKKGRQYSNFKEAIETERRLQRTRLLNDPTRLSYQNK